MTVCGSGLLGQLILIVLALLVIDAGGGVCPVLCVCLCVCVCVCILELNCAGPFPRSAY
jgi:hypothetical protein